MLPFYRGAEGQWAWMLHRISGLGVLVFLILHIVDIWLVGFGPEVFNELLFLYRHPLFRFGEFLVFAGVIYHALNGVRIIALDFWAESSRAHRQLFWAAMISYIILVIPVAWIMLSHYLESLDQATATIR